MTQHQIPSRDPRPAPSQRIKAASPEDVLAYIQCTLGFRPVNSLIIVAFANQQLSTVIRCDLPLPLHRMLIRGTIEHRTYQDHGLIEDHELRFNEIGQHLGRLLAQEPSTTSCLMIYRADEVGVSDHQALAVAGTANAVIAAQVGVHSVVVEESWLIHHQRLWHLRCGDTLECQVQNQALGDPCETELFRALDPQHKTVNQPTATARRLAFPPASRRHRQPLTDPQTFIDAHPAVALDILRRWDQHVGEPPSWLHTAQALELLTALEHPRLRRTVMALACFDFETALRGMVALGDFSSRFGLAAGLRGNASDAHTVKAVFLGQSQRAPHWERIARLERLCRQLLPLSDNHTGGGVAGLLAWIEWLRGRGSIALQYLRQARQYFPAEPFLVSLQRLLDQGIVAGWATRRHCAWTPQHSA